MATINDIAAKLGISKSTVSKGLNNATDISEDMRRRILETAVELGYINKRAYKHEKKICILVANMEYDTPYQFAHDIILGFKQKAEPEGWEIDIVDTNNEMQKMTPYEVYMMEHRYAAAFVLGFSLLDPWMKEFKTTKFPTVLYDNYIKSNPNVASIGCDSQEGFELAVKHLQKLGHEKIGLITGPPESYIIQARYNAYVNALEKYGLEVNPNYIGIGYYVSESVRTHIPKLLEQGITAILFSHDARAIAAITECRDCGIRIPQDISIIGFDDLPMAEYTDPALTTIRQDRLSLGKCGYYALTCLLNKVPIGSITLRATLIERNSTGPVPETPISIHDSRNLSQKKAKNRKQN